MRIDFGRMFSLLASRFAEREALVNVERGRRYTFGELDRLTNRIANLLRDSLGLRRGDIYLCILENDNLSLLHLWTVFRAEATAAWTNYRDSQEEHLRQIDFVKPKAVFLERELVARYYAPLRARGIAIVCMDPDPEARPGALDFWELVSVASDAPAGVEREDRSDVGLLRFTGGTTGIGKCAAYTLDNWLACRDGFYAHPEPLFAPETRLLHFAPMSHGSGMLTLPTLFHGGCTLTQNAPDLARWCRTVELERATASMMVPTLLYRLLELPEAEKRDLSTLSTLFYGAAPMSPSKLALLQSRFGNVFVQLYGATECCTPVTCMGKADHASAAEEDASRLASAGRVTPGVELRVVDDQGSTLPSGETGEIWIRARSTITGYYENPTQTAEEFVDGFWKSGDLGWIDAHGFVRIVDRKKDMIVSGGFNVYATEVEAALNAHPAVLMSAVVGVPHEEWGEAIHAEVMLKPGASVLEAELIEHAKARLARFKSPKTVSFVAELPLSAVGKVLRRQVREKYWVGQERRVS